MNMNEKKYEWRLKKNKAPGSSGLFDLIGLQKDKQEFVATGAEIIIPV